MKRYFEFSEGSSNKFWEIWCEGATVYTRYGKIGSQGQLTLKELASKAAAKAQHDKLVDEKTGKGYEEKGAKKPAAKAKGNVAAPAPVDDDIIEIPDGATRLEFIDGTSRKFYQVADDGKKLVTTFGRIGTEGTTETKKFKHEYEARVARTRAIEEKQRKGYLLVVAGPRIAPNVGARNATLEAQIVKDYSDDNFAVYADWLQEQGDVRGELGALQAQVAKKPKDKKLANQVEKLLWENRTRIYGPLAPYASRKPDPNQELPVIPTWRYGWFDTLELGAAGGHASGTERVCEVRNVAELVRLLPKTVSARLVRELVISRAISDDQYSYHEAIAALVDVMPELPALRRLTIGHFTSSDCEVSWSSHGKLAKLWPVANKLEYLRLKSGEMDLAKIALPECRELHIQTGGLSRTNIKAILAASWPKLETLSIWYGRSDYGCNCTVADAQAILDGKFPRLKHLGLKNAEFGNELAPLVVKSRLLRQLETLDVGMSHLTTAGLQTYVTHAGALKHLKSIDFSRCLLDEAGQKQAKKLAKHVEVERQQDPQWYEEEDYRYTAVGE